MDVATASEQRSYLFSCVSLTLQKRLRSLVQRNTPIYDTVTEKGCMTVHRRGVHGHPPGGRAKAGLLQRDPGDQAVLHGVRGHREIPGGRGRPGLHHAGDAGGHAHRRRDQGREAPGEVPQRGQPDVRQPDAHRQRVRARKGGEQGHRRADGQRPTAAAAAVQQTSDGRSTGARQKTGSAAFPRDFYKKHADNLRKQGKCPWCGGACKGKFCDKKSSDLACTHCNKKGHVKEVCATLAWEKAGKPEQAKVVREEDEEEEEAAVSVVTLNTVAAFAPTPRINARIEGGGSSFRFPCLPDTGATRTVIASDVARAHGLRPVSDDKVKIRAANGNNMACEGTVSITIAYKSFSTRTTALVSSCLSDEILIGWQDLVGLAIIHEGFPAQIKVVGATSDRPVDLADLVERYNDVFRTGRSSP
jgi:hypothetical protein